MFPFPDSTFLLSLIYRLDGQPDTLTDSSPRLPATPAPAQPCGKLHVLPFIP